MKPPAHPTVQTALHDHLSEVVAKAHEENRSHVLTARQVSAAGNPAKKGYDPRVQSYYDGVQGASENLEKARKHRNR